MRDTDDRMLEESYDKINEGIFDRMGASKAGREAVRAAGGKTGLGGLAQKAKRGVIQGLGGELSRKEKRQVGAEGIAKSKGQVNALTASYMMKIQKIAQQYGADVQKLGVDLSMIDDKAARDIVRMIMAYQPPVQGE